MEWNVIAMYALIFFLSWFSEPTHKVDYLVWNQRDCNYRVTMFTPNNQIYASFDVPPKQVMHVTGKVKFTYFKIFFIKTKVSSDCGCVEYDDCPDCISIDRIWSDGDNFAVRQNIRDGFMITRNKCIDL